MSPKTSEPWFLSRRAWFLRGMLYALLFGCLAWWVTGVLAATAIGLLAAATIEYACAEIRLKELPVRQASAADAASRSTAAKLFRWLIGPKFAIPIAVFLFFVVVWPPVLAVVLRWHDQHPDVLSTASLEAFNALFLLAVFGGGIGALGFVPGQPPLRIATITGDDVRERFDPTVEYPWEGDTGLPPPPGEIVSANAYIGAGAIAEAITSGAQIVVTGRVADPALVLGPLVARFGWAWDDLDRIASGTLAGHLLECGSQVTGGYFADPGFKDVPQPEAIGFPIAEVEADGSFIITKPPATGGLVDLRTVKEQLLYEIHDPAAYLTPDVVLDITDVEIAPAGPDRVRVSGAHGHAAPERLKVTVGFLGDWFGEGEISYAGPNAFARATLAADVIGKRLDMRRLGLRRRIDLIGVSSAFDNDSGSLRDRFGAEAGDRTQDLRLRLAVSGPNKAAVEGALQEVLALYCCGPAGGGGQRSRVTQRIETRSYLIPRDTVEAGFILQ